MRKVCSKNSSSTFSILRNLKHSSSMSWWTLVIVLFSLLFEIGQGASAAKGKTPSGLYLDDGRGHTVLQQRFSKKDVREISYDILNIMGFHHRPHPHLVDYRSPASQFLLEVYNSISSGSNFNLDVDLSNGENGRRQDWKQKPGTAVPTSTGGPGAKNLSWSEFNVDQADIDAIAKADEIISFANRGHRYSDRLRQYSEEKQFWFDVSEISPHDEVYGAELRLWKKGMMSREILDDISADPASEVIRISVHQISPGVDERSFEETELDEIMTAKWEQGWLRLNVTQAFRHWIKRPSHNFGLVISTKSADSGIEVPLTKTGLASILDAEEHQPFMVAFLKTSDITRGERQARQSSQAHASRVIRSTNGGPTPGATGGGGTSGGGNKQKRNKKSGKKGRNMEFQDALDRPKSCQMGMLYVNFEDLGWKDWVIAPDGFIAYYCHGECSFPLTASMNATNHAIVSTLVHTYYPLEYPKPSCAPNKLGSISMLYYDDNSNVTVKKYKDMVIKSCGCK
ncbi:unnamed protein product [Orchesella dallaii]|uniref:TGF-beta family profile domain-containing protein n=1 Tax=Orchesella dallaii TaxID=48710 RepID=A0ABP1S5N7_9HEXA